MHAQRRSANHGACGAGPQRSPAVPAPPPRGSAWPQRAQGRQTPCPPANHGARGAGPSALPQSPLDGAQTKPLPLPPRPRDRSSPRAERQRLRLSLPGGVPGGICGHRRPPEEGDKSLPLAPPERPGRQSRLMPPPGSPEPPPGSPMNTLLGPPEPPTAPSP
ncbi:basic salivary proline-rich protein 3-like [Melanerpes formicivorus]|uniref:basic salivary proline-rich protein 3-like n=1 Tax=Melanerpes formicivorus TaxID=211600 RepID=UPI00358FA528